MSRPPTLPATEITADRLLLRKAHDADRDGLIELQTDPQVRAYLGGPRPRNAGEQYLDAIGTVNDGQGPALMSSRTRRRTGSSGG